jgi:hypothetical protein
MSYIDLQPVLTDWHYDADRISTRKIIGSDGREKIQMRVELGLLQMEQAGRPDGKRPFGSNSLLEHHQRELAKYERNNAMAIGFALSPRECRALWEEASLYYQRYVALFVLEEFDLVTRDTAHNIAILDICRDYALERKDRFHLESSRPYVLMMDSRARALKSLADGSQASALAHVNRGLMHIRTHFENWGRPEAYDSAEEVKLLLELRAELGADIPENPILVTRKELRDAIRQERFEEAAKLHKQLKQMYHRNGGES